MDTLPSSAEARLRTTVDDMVLSLFLRDGAFWEAVEALRLDWEITPSVQLPPDTAPWGIYLPPSSSSPRFAPAAFAPFMASGIDALIAAVDDPEAAAAFKAFNRLRDDWEASIRHLHDNRVPADLQIRNGGVAGPFTSYLAGLPRGGFRDSPWARCLSACAIYDPPGSELEAFAKHVTFAPTTAIAPRWERRASEDANGARSPNTRMVMPSVVLLNHPEQAAATEQWHANATLLRLEELLAPQGINVRDLVSQIYHDLLPERIRRLKANPPRPYIAVEPHTTERDVINARKLIIGCLGSRTPPPPKRSPLIAVQCAILRQNGWTWTEIAKHFGWGTQDPPHDGYERQCETARAHVRYGRQILNESRRSA